MKKETDSKQENKRKNTVVKLQKEYKLSNYILSQIPIVVKPSTFIKNMLSCFDWILFIWT